MKDLNKISAIVSGLSLIGTVVSGGLWLISKAQDEKNGTANAAKWKRNTYIFGGVLLVSTGAFMVTKNK